VNLLIAGFLIALALLVVVGTGWTFAVALRLLAGAR